MKVIRTYLLACMSFASISASFWAIDPDKPPDKEYNGYLSSSGINVRSKTVYYRQRYQVSCGFLAISRCTEYRERSKLEYTCCDGWKPRSKYSSECAIPYCVSGWNSCPNGGTCIRPNYCSCYTGYYSPDCKRCTQISNCKIEECTNSYNQRCHTCEYSYGPAKRAFKPVASSGYQERICKQLCSWRSDSKQCYPGICLDDTPSSCQCAPGFTTSNCMTIYDMPETMHCLATASDARNEIVENKCEETTTATKYTNMHLNKIKIDWKSRYHGPVLSDYPEPYYIEKYKVGVTEAKVVWRVVRNSKQGRSPILANGIIDCNHGASGSSPDAGALHACDKSDSFAVKLQTGDILEFKPQVKNGGYLKVRNYDSGPDLTRIETKYYTGKERSHSSSFTFDDTLPIHCLTACSSNMLDRGDPFTKQPKLNLKWNGWSDGLAGIASYEFEIYKLRKYGQDELNYKDAAINLAQNQSYTSLPNSPPYYVLPESGLYCILLIVTDHAGNHRLARRFVMFDNSSIIEISADTDKMMFVTSAASNTDYTWITSLNGQVNLTWKGHFFNEMHRKNKLLSRISPHIMDTIEASYEERTGQPHVTRSMEAIPNVNGIVRYDIAYGTDHQGGRSIMSPSAFQIVSNFKVEETPKQINRSDGDSIRFWIKASDVMNNTITDQILVHVDSSPPIIENVGLVRNGQKSLMVHNNLDLFSLNVEFDTYDYHSGAKEIAWELHDMKTPSVVHGSGHLAVHRTNKSDCIAPACYCIPKDDECFYRTYDIVPDMSKMKLPHGNHDYDYYIVITVTNNAMLKTILKFQISIDSSPPMTGHVYDSTPGEIERDYQSDFTVHASWNSFFDRESGVMLYKYAITSHCLQESDFENSMNVVTTNETFASKVMKNKGTYFTTVVAYNNALEPSLPVCSDGVTIDDNPPIISSVEIENIFIQPGLVKKGNMLKFIDQFGYVYVLNYTSDNCSQYATNLEYLPILKIKEFPLPLRLNQDNCSSYEESGKKMFLNKENFLSLTWEGTDLESAIYDYKIALSSTDTPNADILPFTSTHGKNQFITYHTNLVNTEEVYLNIKAINKAGLETLEIIGPIEVRISGPVFDANIAFTYQQDGNDWYLLAKWNKDSWDDDDISDSLISEVDFALGENDCSGNIQEWTKINEKHTSKECQITWPPTCVAIKSSTMRFHLHRENSYCVSLRARGFNGMSTTKTAMYTYLKGVPMTGSLIEVKENHPELNEDIDFQTSNSTIAFKYLGHYLPPKIEYLVGVGTSKNKDDVKIFKPLSVSISAILINDLKLQYFKTYFVTIKAVYNNTFGDPASISSDGITILPNDVSLNGFVALDGLSCKHVTTELLSLVNHHVSLEDIPKCGDEVNYQPYTTILSAYWNNNFDDKFITNFKVYAEKQNKSNQNWQQYGPTYNYSRINEVLIAGINLLGGIKYRLSVQPCHPASCYKEVKTDGVMILPTEPIAGDIIQASYHRNNNSISIKWKIFQDPFLGINSSIISQYQFALFVKYDGLLRQQLNKWETIPFSKLKFNHDKKEITSMLTLSNRTIEASACFQLSLKGYNKAMLSSVTHKDLIGCNVESVQKLSVIDAVGNPSSDGEISNIFLAENELWPFPDSEYTPATSSLAAVWPLLRNEKFKWKVVTGEAMKRKAYYVNDKGHLTYFDFECTSPAVLACGSTEKRFINVHGLNLQEGERYHICVYANETTLVHEKWTDPEYLSEVSACSNGIVVDTLPPHAGHVWTGNKQKESCGQSDSFALVVHWNGFTDTEIHGNTPHHSGIKTYYLAIGSSNGETDVMNYLDVGLVNIKVLNGLSLINGLSYYVTIKAVDYTGHDTVVTSDPVVIDNSPPATDTSKLYIDSNILTPVRTVTISYLNGTFTDRDSGISTYYWCIGSSNLFCDVMDFRELASPFIEIKPATAKFQDGKKYVVHLQAVNGVGLSALVTSEPFIVDTTPPTTGFVNDILPGTDNDADFQTSTTYLHVNWGGFSDPHSHIVEYKISIGDSNNDRSVLNDVYVGLKTEHKVDRLSLRPGETYYCKVTACNGAGLCTYSISDGILIDNTPPHIGKILDGIHGEDVDYQASRTVISALLENIHDMQSLVSSIYWWAGTTDGDNNIINKTLSHSHDILHMQLQQELKLDSKVYVTVNVCNKAGLCTMKSSDGVVIDSTAPVFKTGIKLSNTTGSLKENTQIFKNTMRLEWRVEDSNSPISNVYISLLSSTNVHFMYPTIKLFGNPDHFLFSNLSLGDGDNYKAKVMACNKAGLCSSSTSDTILCDSSLPTDGAFAVETDHAIDLSRHRTSWMTFDNDPQGEPSIKLAYVGFQDPHSNINSYLIKIGTTFHGTELNVNKEELLVSHMSSELQKDEGYIQKQIVTINKTINPNDVLFVSITAINGVGLRSAILQGEFIAILSGGNTGILQLNRRCRSLNCMGHCACVPHGSDTCHQINQTTCVNKTGDAIYAVVNVRDIIPSYGMDSVEIDYSQSKNIIAASWSVENMGKQPLRFDWSAGVYGNAPGSGLFDLTTQQLWHEAGINKFAIFSTSESNLADVLSSHVTYVFYVRAWYDENNYAIFNSNGVKIDITSPEFSSSYKVIETTNQTLTMDNDFINSTSSVTVNWKYVFRDKQSGLQTFEVQLFSDEEIQHLYKQDLIEETKTNITINNLNFEEGKHYYSVVIACNNANLCSRTSSDGFVVDISTPNVGVVYDGIGLYDVDYTSDNMTVSSSWQGFFDEESFIDHYVWCVGTSPGLDDIYACKRVGLNTNKKERLQSAVANGIMIYSTIYAVNGAGLSSIKISSNGVLIDTTPPKSINQFKLGSNVVNAETFDGNVSEIESHWNIQTTKKQWFNDQKYVCVYEGYIQQSLQMKQHQKYKVSFKAKSGSNSSFAVLGYIMFGNNYHRFSDGRLFNMDANNFFSFHFYFNNGVDDNITLELGSIGHAIHICFDDVNVRLLTKGIRSTIAKTDPSSQYKEPIHIHISSSPQSTSLIINWDFEDLQSPIVDYMFAVGSVKGGVQLQDYKSTGILTSATVTGLSLPHGLDVYVSVVAKNAAGLTTIIYSDPVTVDLRPPVILEFKVNDGNLFLTTQNFQITWQSEDKESGVLECKFSAGSSINTDNIVFEVHLSDKGTKIVSADNLLKNHEKFYCHLVCISFANHVSSKMIGPLTFIDKPPNIDTASLNVIPESSTYYGISHNHLLSVTEIIWLRMDGIQLANLEECKINIKDNASNILPWHSLGTSQDHVIALTNGSHLFEQNTYHINMKCLNKGQLESKIITTNFTVLTDAPVFTENPFGVYWPDDSSVDLDWTGLFTSSTEMIYEFHLGTTQGGIDVMSWVETKDTKLTIKPIDSSKIHYCTVTAINSAGLFTTQTFKVKYG